MEPKAHKGRGALTNPASRYRTHHTEAVDDGWWQAQTDERPDTQVAADNTRSIIARNTSPDVPFNQSINAYWGCEHGCIYCFARPTHAYLDLSPGLDFETRLFYKPRAAALLRAELSDPRYVCQPIALGTNTDPYQPIEKRFAVTRQILEVLDETNHPVTIVTKGTLIGRDIETLANMAERNLVHVMMSIPTLDRSLKRTLEPRAADPKRRLRMIEMLASRGIPTGVLVAPVIPALTDEHMETVLREAAAAGADRAGYVALRLPLEVAPLFEQWLAEHRPDRAAHVMSIVRQMHGGKDYQSDYGTRQRGTGVFAELLAKRFALACKRHGLTLGERVALNTADFRPPVEQLALL